MKKRLTRNSKRQLIASLTVAVASSLCLLGYYLTRPSLSESLQVLSAPAATQDTINSKKPTVAEQASYSVSPERPRLLRVISLGIEARILPMSVLASGAMEAPQSAWDVGWYDESSLPGTGIGALLIDGHVNDSLDQPGIFYDLIRLKVDDVISIEKGNGEILTYKVMKVDQQPVERVDMAAMLQSITPNTEGLNLITCGGTYDYTRQTYRDRVLVYTVRISS